MCDWMRSLRAVLAGAGFALLAGCADMNELFSYGDEAEHAQARAEAESAQLWEMSIMAGRYGAMLGQAREILNLPEPRRSATDVFPAEHKDEAKAREALARYQVSVTQEFLADVSSACARKRVPRSVRKFACEQQAKVPADLKAPVAPEIKPLSLRNDRVGEFVMPWWDAVCATAKRRHNSDEPVCAME